MENGKCFEETNQKYIELIKVFEMAYERASKGKGYQRHSFGEPFEQQMICRGPRIFGIGALLYQIYKKTEEVTKLDLEAKINEFLDIINYSAAAVIILKEKTNA